MRRRPRRQLVMTSRHTLPSCAVDPTLRFTIPLSSPDLPPKVGENAKIILYSAISLFRMAGPVTARNTERDTNLSLYDFPSRIRDALLEVVLKAAIECAEMQSQSTFFVRASSPRLACRRGGSEYRYWFPAWGERERRCDDG